VKIHYSKGADGLDQVICRREDGSTCQTDLPPHCVYHDLAHFVVESHAKVADGFWGRIAQGYTFQDYSLPEDERPFAITESAIRAEYLATLLQASASTGQWNQAYAQYLQQAAESVGNPFPEMPSPELQTLLIAQIQSLYHQWEKEGELVISFNYTS
jgi:hypothetical protein